MTDTIASFPMGLEIEPAEALFEDVNDEPDFSEMLSSFITRHRSGEDKEQKLAKGT